jgi:hypothetical protein
VYEQAPMLGEVGAGLQVSPNAARVLYRLGLAGALGRTGVAPLAWHQRRWDDGRTLLRTPLAGSLEAAFGFPRYQLHRADLLAALADALPPDRIHLGQRRPRRGRGAGGRRRHPLGGPEPALRPPGPALHRLCGLPGAGPGRPAGRPAAGGDRSALDGAG